MLTQGKQQVQGGWKRAACAATLCFAAISNPTFTARLIYSSKTTGAFLVQGICGFSLLTLTD
jgi:hypothetical protein